MSFYQKYRSEKIADLDLDSVRKVFESMMNSGRIAHAYLFLGPRGLGKTSSARILARLVNCERNYQKLENSKAQKLKDSVLVEPCNECDNCLSIKNGSAVDVMEIDAASHRGIDDIRELRERVSLAPSILPKKVYIIDEVHMLTTEAFNALLKTLEEPPAHAMFILCTTEAHKVPDTIVSRCVKVPFSKASPDELVRSLRRAAKGEGIKAEDGALEELASGLDGSFREGHKLLEQLSSQTDVLSKEFVKNSLRTVGGDQVSQILNLVRSHKTLELMEMIAQLEDSGADVLSLVQKMLISIRGDIRSAIRQGKIPQRIDVRLAQKLVVIVPKIKKSPVPMLPLELLLEQISLLKEKSGGGKMNVVEKVIGRETSELKVNSDRNIKVKNDIPGIESVVMIESEILTNMEDRVVEKLPDCTVEFEKVVSGWQEMLSRLSMKNNTLAGLLRSAKPVGLDNKFLTIEVFYKFHKDQLEMDSKRRILEDEMSKMWGPISVRCVLGTKLSPKSTGFSRVSSETLDSGPKGDDVKLAEEVFGV